MIRIPIAERSNQRGEIPSILLDQRIGIHEDLHGSVGQFVLKNDGAWRFRSCEPFLHGCIGFSDGVGAIRNHPVFRTIGYSSEKEMLSAQDAYSLFQMIVVSPKTSFAIATTRTSESPYGGLQYLGILPSVEFLMISMVYPSYEEFISTGF